MASQFCVRCGEESIRRFDSAPNCGAVNPAAYAYPAGGRAITEVPPEYQPATATAAPPVQRTPISRPPPGMPAPAATTYASFWVRSLAWLIDAVVVQVASFFTGVAADVMMMGAAFAGSEGLEVAGGLFYYIFGIVLAWRYDALQTSSKYQATIGKRVLGIQVGDLNGRGISFAKASGCRFARMFSGLTLGIGYFIQPFTERRKALHDMLAQTVVLTSPTTFPS